MKLIGYTVINSDGGLLSRIEIKPAVDGHELDVSFGRDYRRCISVKKLKQVSQTIELLRGAFPDQQFEVVQLSRAHGQYLVDLPPNSNPPAWVCLAVASLCDAIAA